MPDHVIKTKCFQIIYSVKWYVSCWFTLICWCSDLVVFNIKTLLTRGYLHLTNVTDITHECCVIDNGQLSTLCEDLEISHISPRCSLLIREFCLFLGHLSSIICLVYEGWPWLTIILLHVLQHLFIRICIGMLFLLLDE